MLATTNNGENIIFQLSSQDTLFAQVIGNITINDGEWHLIVATVSNTGKTASIYIDTELDEFIHFNNNSYNSYNLTNGRNIVIGMNDVTRTSDKYTGLIDGVRLYSKEMSISDMKCLYNFTIPTPMPTNLPSILPTNLPTNIPTIPTTSPTKFPSIIPTSIPSNLPTVIPTAIPSK